MCGIYGWQWRKEKRPSMQQRAVLAAILGHENDTRGGDSWGLYSPDENAAVRGLDCISPHARNLAMFDSIIAHTRKATTGGKTEANAHPFEIGNIVGAHNGMVHNHTDLNKELGRNYEVDSMHIFKGLDDGTGLSGIRGYGAIEWLDRRDRGQIFLCRASSSADLASVETIHGVVWSSAKKALEIAMELSGIADPKDIVSEVDFSKVLLIEGGHRYTTDTKLKFEEYQYSSAPYGSRYAGSKDIEQWQRDWEDPRSTPPARVGELFSLSKNARANVKKTIGRAALLELNGSTWLCEQCCREVNGEKKCPRGHTGKVLELRAPGPGASK